MKSAQLSVELLCFAVAAHPDIATAFNVTVTPLEALNESSGDGTAPS